MSNKKIQKFLKKPQANSGFTLTELLTGLIMSIFVSGALGFGLMQIMQVTAKEQAKSNVRNEATRAVEFISDELRRASEIEPDAINADGIDDDGNLLFDTSGKTIVFALNVPEINESDTLGSDDNIHPPGTATRAVTSERIIYYLQDSSGNWEGPQVLYRWGPPLNANGNYTNGTWQHEALIDGIDDTVITTDPCTGGDTLNPSLASNPSGFYACINANNTAAQIFLTGGIDTDTVAGNDDSYTANTRTVARAKEVSVSSSEATPGISVSLKSLEADYTCDPYKDSNGNPIDLDGNPLDSNGNIIPNQTPRQPKAWDMRIDFDNTEYNGNGERPNRNQAASWIHGQYTQEQIININTETDLILHTIPYGQTNCLNKTKGNEWASASNNLSDFVGEDGLSNLDKDVNGETVRTHTISQTIQFQEAVANRLDNPDYWKTFNGNNPDTNYNNPNVDPSGKMIVLKDGSVLESSASINTSANVASAPLYPGYDFDNNGTPDRPSLGRFLYDKGYAVPNVDENSTEYSDFLDKADKNSANYDPNFDPSSGYKITLEDTQRIIAIEIGQEDNGDTNDVGNDSKAHPGFDLQDSVFVMNHGIFAKDHGAVANERSSGDQYSSY